MCQKQVTYTIHRYKEHHTVVDLHRSGRKKISTPRDQRSLINAVKKDRRMTSSQLAVEWTLTNGRRQQALLPCERWRACKKHVSRQATSFKKGGQTRY
jgi:hypothetical protein